MIVFLVASPWAGENGYLRGLNAQDYSPVLISYVEWKDRKRVHLDRPQQPENEHARIPRTRLSTDGG